MAERSWIIGFLNLTVMKISQKRTSENIEEQLMSSQADSLASLFPTLGEGGGQADERYLWPEMLRVIGEVRPTWVIGENVAGITTMVEQCRITEMGSQASLFEEGNGVYRYNAEFTFTIERVCSDLESMGYSVQPILVPACAVGAPHRRDRVFIIANDIASDSKNSQCVRGSRANAANAAKEGKERISERNKIQRPDESIDVRSKISGIIENTLRDGLRCGQASKQGSERNKRNFGARDCERICGKERLLPEERWKGFPTVSAVHRGNDGFPFDVDCLSIPFAKWRNESLKAYGNAIVPQVMYRIFEAVEAVERL